MPAKKEKQDKNLEETQDTPDETVDTGVDTLEDTPTDTDTPTEETQDTPDAPQVEKEDEDVSANKAKKSLDEIREDRKARRLADREALLDTTRVFAKIATNYGPAFVVVDMPKVDAKAFGKNNIVASKLDVGTRVNNEGKALKKGQEIDAKGDIVSDEEEEGKDE